MTIKEKIMSIDETMWEKIEQGEEVLAEMSPIGPNCDAIVRDIATGRKIGYKKITKKEAATREYVEDHEKEIVNIIPIDIWAKMTTTNLYNGPVIGEKDEM